VPRVAVFIDGANIYHAQRDRLRWWIDWKRFRQFLDHFGEVVICIYYTGRDAGDAIGAHDKFLTMLAHNGFSIEFKDVKTNMSLDGVPVRKANLDIELVLDMINQIDNYDLAILVSGDGDFERPLRLLRDRGKQFRVLSTYGTVAEEIRWFAGPHFIDFQELRADLERQRGASEY